MNSAHLRYCVFFFGLFISANASADAPRADGLRLGYFEEEAALNRPGYESIENGVPVTFVVDNASELSDTRSLETISPLIDWYRNRGQLYLAYDSEAGGLDYLTVDPSTVGAVGVEGNIQSITLDGAAAATVVPNMNNPTYLAAMISAAKEYVDAGADGIQYDVGSHYPGGGSFDSTTVSGFYNWLTTTLGYSDADLSSLFGTTVSSDFDYRVFLLSEGVTEDEGGFFLTGLIDDSAVRHTAHYRLWRAYQSLLEREWMQTLTDEVNAYSLASDDSRPFEFQFNHYGFDDTPARNITTASYASSLLGETYLGRPRYPYLDGFSMEPIFRLYMNTFNRRYETWNEPTKGQAYDTEFVGIADVFTAEKIAANSADMEPADRGLLAWRYQDYVDLDTRSDVAIFYPLANVQHNVTLQSGAEPAIFGNHAWYVGTGYFLNELNVDFDVVIGGDDLAMPDTITADDFSAYTAVVVPEIAQLTDSQFTALFDYANAGGHLIFTGTDLLKYDVLGNDVSADTSRRSTNEAYAYEDIFWEGITSAGKQSYGSNGGTYWVINAAPVGSESFVRRNNPDSADMLALNSYRESFEDAFSDVGVIAKTHTGIGDIRVNSYVTADGSDAYWLVNKRFANGGRSVAAQANVTLTLPDPGYSGSVVVSYAEDGVPEMQTLSFSDADSTDGVIEVTIPSLSVLGLLVVGSEATSTAIPDLEPAAEFVYLYDYEVFTDEATTIRDLAVKAADDSQVARLKVYAQTYNSSDSTWSSWYDAEQDFVPSTPTNRLGDLDLETLKATLETIPIDLESLGEGRHRLRLIAVDDANQFSQDVTTIGYADTEVGYDTSPPDTSGLVVTVMAGPENGGVVNTFPNGVTLSFSGVTDAQSGVDSINAASFVDGNTVDGERASDYVDGVSQNYFESVSDPDYGTYSVLARTSNLAGEYGDFESVYSFIYTVPPTFEGMSYNTVEADGTSTDASLSESDNTVVVEAGTYVTLNADFASVYGQNEGLVTVQWYRDGEIVEGATETSINLGAVTQGVEGEYTVVFTDPGGEVTSFSVSVEVTQVLEITSQPSGYQNDNAIAAGDSFTVSVGAVGEGTLTYQWYFKLEPGEDVYVLLEGATADSYTVESAVRSEHQGRYYVVVGDDTGNTVTSNTARVEVQGGGGGGGGGGGPASLNITQQPVGYEGPNALTTGDSFTLTVGVSGEPPLSYQWSFSVQPGDGTFVNIEGATESSYSVASVTPENHNGRYRVTVTDGLGNTAQSIAVQVIVSAPSDLDNDGVPDDTDNCVNDANPEQVDSDGDGIGNVCDVDNDNDGIPNLGDNCPAISNPDQLDFDNDGLGDACDGDADADAVMDASDSCPYTPLGEIVNASGCSVSQLSKLDSDEDGLDDATEEELGTDPNNADSDGDGISDSEEVEAESDPLDATDAPVPSGLSIFIIKAAVEAANDKAQQP